MCFSVCANVSVNQWPDGPSVLVLFVLSVLFRFLAVLDPRVGHTMDVLCSFMSVLCHFN